VSYTISSDGASVSCPRADYRLVSDTVIQCGWNCGTYKGMAGYVILAFSYESPSFYLSVYSVSGYTGCK